MKISALIVVVALAPSAVAGQFSALITAAAVATNPNPQPAPSPNGRCENCNGTGKLGDGTVMLTCMVCGGDGVLEASQAASGGSAFTTLTDPGAAFSPDQQPTPMAAIGEAMRLLRPRGKVFIDVGCGFDCRAGIVAVRDFSASRVLAIEIDPATAESARRYVEHAGLSDKIQVVTADAAAVDFPSGAVGFAYLFPDQLQRLAPKLRQLERFVSFAHAPPGITTTKTGDLYVYEKPKPQSAVAMWNGRQYSRPVCNNGRCAMCNAIRRQLAMR